MEIADAITVVLDTKTGGPLQVPSLVRCAIMVVALFLTLTKGLMMPLPSHGLS